MPLSPEHAKKFFSSLYEDKTVGLQGNFETMVTRLVSRKGEATVAGDQALQSLMINYVLANPARVETAKGLGAALAGIKAMAVTEFVKAFPNADLNTLIAEAKKSGYDVEVIRK